MIMEVRYGVYSTCHVDRPKDFPLNFWALAIENKLNNNTGLLEIIILFNNNTGFWPYKK